MRKARRPRVRGWRARSARIAGYGASVVNLHSTRLVAPLAGPQQPDKLGPQRWFVVLGVRTALRFGGPLILDTRTPDGGFFHSPIGMGEGSPALSGQRVGVPAPYAVSLRPAANARTTAAKDDQMATPGAWLHGAPLRRKVNH